MNFRALIVLLALASSFGCSTTKQPKMLYTDEQWQPSQLSTTRSAKTDAVVRVERWKGRAIEDVKALPTTVPADAKKLVSTEVLAVFGRQFYATVGLPEQRFELGGVITQSHDTTGGQRLRGEFAYREKEPGGCRSVQTRLMQKWGEAKIVMACADGSYITLTIEPPK